RQIDSDAIGLASRLESQSTPVDGNLATPDAKKATEVDDGGAHLTRAIDDHINDASHILALAAADALTQDPGHLLIVEYRRGCAGWGGVRRRRGRRGWLG